jgi:hypothetical protein
LGWTATLGWPATLGNEGDVEKLAHISQTLKLIFCQLIEEEKDGSHLLQKEAGGG